MINTGENNDNLLSEFVRNNEYKPSGNELPPNTEVFGSNIRQKVEKIEADGTWINIPTRDLPYGEFYPDGTMISIRPVKTKEMQSFAVVNEKNPYDVQVKLNELLSACLKIENVVSRAPMSYLDIIDGDRDTIAIVLAKASAKYGKKIEKVVKCTCSLDVNIELIPANYTYKTHHEKMINFFNKDTKRYEFKLNTGASIKLAPPTIGLAQAINNYIIVKSAKSGNKETPNLAFMQTFPYIQAGKGVKTMEYDEIAQAEYEFSKMNDDLFQFTYEAIDMIAFGIEDVKSTCTCGREVHTHFGFPDGARNLFFIRNAFDQFTR